MHLKRQMTRLCRCAINNHDTGKEVYIAVLRKSIHACFAVVYRQLKETNVDKRSMACTYYGNPFMVVKAIGQFETHPIVIIRCVYYL